MVADAHANFAYSTIATAPSPASSGTSLVVAAGEGTKFPAVPFNVTIWPIGTQPSTTNAEIARVTARATDTLTITRAQESTSARTVVVGDQVAATITALTLTDAEKSWAGAYATSAAEGKTALGLGTVATQSVDNVFLLDGTVNYNDSTSGIVPFTADQLPMYLQLGTDLAAAAALGAVLASVAFAGPTNTSGAMQPGASIRSIAEETFASGHSGSRLEFRTTAITGSVTPGLRANITSAGTLNIAPSYTSSLTTGGTFAVKADGSIWGGAGLAYTSNEPSDANFKVSTAGNITTKGTLTALGASAFGSTGQATISAAGAIVTSSTLSVTGHPTLEGVTATGATGTGKLVFDGTPTLVTPVIGAATGTSLAATGAITSSGTAGIGYATGAGGTVTQATSRTTTVVNSKMSGTITLFTATLAADTDVTFTWTNTLLAAADSVIWNVVGGAAVKGGYAVDCIPAAGSATVTVRNVTPTITASEAPVLKFTVIKAVNA